MPPCVICQATTAHESSINRHTVAICESCLTRVTAGSRSACPTCGARTRKTRSDAIAPTERDAKHDERVLSAVTPERSWRDIARASGLRVPDAMRARERLIASGRLIEHKSARGSVGACYRVDEHGRKLPGNAYSVPATLLPPLKP